MQSFSQTATLAVVVLGLFALGVARLPSFRNDFRRSVSTAVGAVSLLTLLLSLNVMLTAMNLHASAADHESAMINGLLLAGLVLMLVSTLALFFSLGLLIWTLVPSDGTSHGHVVTDSIAASRQPVEPYTP